MASAAPPSLTGLSRGAHCPSPPGARAPGIPLPVGTAALRPGLANRGHSHPASRFRGEFTWRLAKKSFTSEPMICWGDLAVQRWGMMGSPSTRSAYRTQPVERPISACTTSPTTPHRVSRKYCWPQADDGGSHQEATTQGPTPLSSWEGEHGLRLLWDILPCAGQELGTVLFALTRGSAPKQQQQLQHHGASTLTQTFPADGPRRLPQLLYFVCFGATPGSAQGLPWLSA